MNALIRYGIILLLILTPTALAAQSAPVDIAPELEPIRREYAFPAVGAAVITEGRLQALGVVGVRRCDSNVPAEPDDPFHLGSCTKAMTASLASLLVAEGKLDWTTTLADYFPEFGNRLHPDYRDVTLVHLLSHRAGLPSMTAGFAPVEGETLQDVLRLSPRRQRYRVAEIVLSQAPLHKPGETYLYSNAGYSIAGAVIEKITDKSWEDLISRRLFEPLGMTTAGFGAMGTTDRLDAPWQHAWRDDRLVPINPGPHSDNPPFLGPGGRVHCSMTDWTCYIRAVLAACRHEKGLLPATEYEGLATPPFGGAYALGWKTCQRQWGGHVLTHAGTNTMNYAVTWVAPERNFAVLVATNCASDRAAEGLDKICGLLIHLFLDSK